MIASHELSSSSVDGILSALADQHRRLAIRCLIDSTDQTATLRELAQYVRGRFHEERSVKEIKTNLHHSHVPKLVGAGLLEYDARSKTVRYRAGSDTEALVKHILGMERT
jgi:DNA-binding transcriptional ArsR family regulator